MLTLMDFYFNAKVDCKAFLERKTFSLSLSAARHASFGYGCCLRLGAEGVFH